MTATWTEKWSSITLAGTNWQNYDIFTNLGVPKGAIAHVIMFNGNAAVRNMGVRTDGSSLARYLPVHASVTTDGGKTSCAMYVKVDSSTGLIETYVDNTTGVLFYCSGYWTDIDFTETMSSLTTSNTAAWRDWDVGALGAPDGSVCSVACCNYSTSAQILGLRTNGSSLTRSHTHHRTTGTAASCFTISVKSNATDGIVEVWNATSTNKYVLLGYFDSNMDYQETVWTFPSSGTSNVWTDWNTGGVVPANSIADIMVAETRSFAYEIGARANGSSLQRYWTEHYPEDTYRSGECLPTAVDANGIYEIYEYDYSYCRNGPYGYYIPIASATLKPFTFCVFVG